VVAAQATLQVQVSSEPLLNHRRNQQMIVQGVQIREC
jgi:hypothetical protein